jgi:hypothetical protein
VAQVSSATRVWRRAARALLCVAHVMLGTQACTEPTFSDRDADAEGALSQDGAPAQASDATSMAGDAASMPDDEASSTPEPDAGSLPADAGTSSSPSDASDATTLDSGAGSVDADASPSAVLDTGPANTLPPWANELTGAYAKRSVTFSYDDSLIPPGNTRNVEYSIVTITPKDGALELTIQLCDFSLSVANDGWLPVVFTNVASTPVMKGRIRLDAERAFSTDPIVQHLGFDPARSNGCAPGNRRMKFPDQTWITGTTCECSSTALPTSTADCRALDSDADGKPGINARGPYRISGALTDVAFVFDHSLAFVDGQVKSGGRHQLREVRAQEAGCLNAAVEPCYAGHNVLCPGGSSVLLPIAPGDQATCAALNRGAFGPLDAFPAEVDCRTK